MRSPLKALPAALAGLAFIAAGASAQAPQSNPSEWNRPYGQSHQDVSQPFAGARSRAGNRVVINGIIQTGVGVSAQASAFAQGSASLGGGVQNGAGAGTGYTFHQATAIANQLNVVVNGNYNTVVVNSRQINSGQVTANAGQTSANAGPAPVTGDSDND
ncbi:holdfast anchoring protein HfaA [Hyphomonadaceae bacterium BL14]|nr:holdfast anchoring protein HfaA [Hyphomonadaceae bacterium BL14]